MHFSSQFHNISLRLEDRCPWEDGGHGWAVVIYPIGCMLLAGSKKLARREDDQEKIGVAACY